MNKAALELVQKASHWIQPINLEALGADPDKYISFLMTQKGKDGQQYWFASGYGNFNPEINELFKVGNIEKTDGFVEEMKKCNWGLGNEHASKNQLAGSCLTEGKDPMPFQLYKKLA